MWNAEKATLKGAQHIKEELDAARSEFETARRAGDLARMSELQYGRIPELEKNLADAMAVEGKETRLLRNNVTEEEIAEVVSKWTGVPDHQAARRRAREAAATREISCISV